MKFTPGEWVLSGLTTRHAYETFCLSYYAMIDLLSNDLRIVIKE
jgi:hypothetical protein